MGSEKSNLKDEVSNTMLTFGALHVKSNQTQFTKCLKLGVTLDDARWFMLFTKKM